MRTGWMAGALLLASMTGAGAQQKEDAMGAIMCGHMQSLLLDDHISDARTIATAVFVRCREDLLAARKKSMPEAEAQAALDQHKQKYIDTYLTYVLKARSGKSPLHQR